MHPRSPHCEIICQGPRHQITIPVSIFLDTSWPDHQKSACCGPEVLTHLSIACPPPPPPPPPDGWGRVGIWLIKMPHPGDEIPCQMPLSHGWGVGGDLTFTPQIFYFYINIMIKFPRGGTQFQHQMQSKSPPIPGGGGG